MSCYNIGNVGRKTFQYELIETACKGTNRHIKKLPIVALCINSFQAYESKGIIF